MEPVREEKAMSSAKQATIHLSSGNQPSAHQPAEDDWHRIAEIGVKFSDDKIVRAGPISEWLWGKWNPRRAYYLAEKTNAYPFFTEASQIAIRKSTVLAHIWAKERRSFRDDREEQLVKLAILLAKLLELVRRRQRSDGITGSDAGLIWIKLLEEILNAVDRILKS
jgi:hypothetical protein